MNPTKDYEMIPTTPEIKQRIQSMFQALENYITTLAVRWLDESEYEDINDYGKAIQGKLPDGFTLTRMTKKPFGFHFHLGTNGEYAVARTMETYSWKRIK